jgi:hypothetical protein
VKAVRRQAVEMANTGRGLSQHGEPDEQGDCEDSATRRHWPARASPCHTAAIASRLHPPCQATARC